MNTSQKFSVNQRGITPVILLIVVAALALVVGGYYWKTQQAVKPTYQSNIQPTAVPANNSDTGNWKTYLNNNLNFSFEYLPDWKLERTPNGIFDILSSSDYKSDDQARVEQISKSGSTLLIPSNTTYSLPSFTKLTEGAILEGSDTTSPKKISNIKELILANQKAQQYDYQSTTSPGLMGTKIEFMAKNGKVYVLDMLYASPSSKKMFEQILSTFKFTDQAGSADISSWKTLQDSDGLRSKSLGGPVLNYSYKYPSDFKVSEVSGVDSHQLLGAFMSNSINIFTYLIRLDHGEGMTDIKSSTKTKLGGKDATRLYGIAPNPTGPTIAYEVANLSWASADSKWGFEFRCTFDNTPDEQLTNLCDQIASTFKFTQ